ncbi:MAG: hypothetical protein KGS60_16760, partial [Verrucomicrobia bacterium]|nr:hypothetical protein [Verrucomicrobiota bacterium]
QSLQGAGGVGGLLKLTDAATGTAHFPAYDGNGNLTALVNASTGAPTATYDYDPFGNLLQATGPLAESNPWRFSTKPADEFTGQYFYGYRDYDPAQGRWLSRDPLGEAGGVNLYGFVGNDAVGQIDPLGLLNLPGAGPVGILPGWVNRLHENIGTLSIFPTFTPFVPLPSTITTMLQKAIMPWADSSEPPQTGDASDESSVLCDYYKGILLRAQLAQASYDGYSPPPGWRVLESYANKNSGLNFSVFVDQSGKVVVSFRGSDMEWPDWINNGMQSQGFIGRQYEQVHNLAESLRKIYPNAEYVGHSLGGGLASAIGGMLGRRTTTFNASGLHLHTLLYFGINPIRARSHVETHSLLGDPLSFIQDAGTAWDLGNFGRNNGPSTPIALGERNIYLPERMENPINLHLMPAMLAKFRKLAYCYCR